MRSEEKEMRWSRVVQFISVHCNLRRRWRHRKSYRDELAWIIMIDSSLVGLVKVLLGRELN